MPRSLPALPALPSLAFPTAAARRGRNRTARGMRAAFAAVATALVLASIAIVGTVPAHATAPRDVAGAKDYPGIGRFAGSTITGYVAKDFDATKVEAGPFKADKPTAEQRVEGKVTRIAYRTAPGGSASILEVARNFETQ